MNKQLLVHNIQLQSCYTLQDHLQKRAKRGTECCLLHRGEQLPYRKHIIAGKVIIMDFYTREKNMPHVFCCSSSIVPSCSCCNERAGRRVTDESKKSTVFLWPSLAFTARCMAASAFSSPTFPTLLPKSCSPLGGHCHLLVHLSILFQSPTKRSWSFHHISPQQHNQLKQISPSNSSELFILRKIKHISLTEEGAYHYGWGKKIPLALQICATFTVLV